MAEEMLNEDEVLARLGISRDELDRMVQEGRLTAEEADGQRKFPVDEVSALEEGATLDLEEFDEESEEDLFDFSEELEGDLDEEAEEAEDEEEAALFEDEDVSTDIVDIGAREESEEEEEIVLEPEGELTPQEETEEGFGLEGEMDTEVVDVSALEEGEEDLLGDIIEDVGEAPEETRESTGQMAGEETVDMEEPTAEITELEEDAFEIGEEETAEITQLEEETFEGEELEDLLAEEEDFAEEAGEEEYEWPGEGAVAPPAEAPVSTWVIVVLVLVFVIQILGGLFVVENALSPDHSTGITGSISLFKPE